MSAEHFIIIGLGSNLGEREKNLRVAITGLSEYIQNIRESAVYASPAMLPPDAPEDWNIPFLNMAICGQTSLSAADMLDKIRQVEADIGRTRKGHWSPREIDIDILAMDDVVMYEENLHIPHPGMLERPFVLLPALDIAPDWKYPRPSIYQGKTLKQIASQINFGDDCVLFTEKLER